MSDLDLGTHEAGCTCDRCCARARRILDQLRDAPLRASAAEDFAELRRLLGESSRAEVLALVDRIEKRLAPYRATEAACFAWSDAIPGRCIKVLGHDGEHGYAPPPPDASEEP